MPQLSQRFFRAAVVFLIVGILMGLQMSITGVYNVTAAHAHTNLLGWVTSALFGAYYAFNPAKAELRLADIHFWSYVAAVAVMTPSLYLAFYGHTWLEPVLAVAAIVALGSVLVFTWIVFLPEAPGTARRPAPAE